MLETQPVLPGLTQGLLLQLRNLEPVFIAALPDHIQKSRDQFQIELDGYERAIRDLEEQLRRIRAERDTLLHQYQALSSLFAPIRRLPSEVLQQIFILAITGPGEGGNMLGSYSRWESQSLRISAVCHRWRCIAIETPEIWTRFAFDLNHKARSPVELFLARSANHPLSVTITEDSLPTYGFDQELCELVVSESSRWCSMDYDPKYFALGHLDFQLQNLPSIRHLVCYAHNLSLPGHTIRERQLHLDTLVIRFESPISFTFAPFANGIPSSNLVVQFGPQGSFDNSLHMLKLFARTIKSLSYETLPTFASPRGLCSETVPSEYDPPVDEPIVCPEVREVKTNLYNHLHGVFPHMGNLFDSLTLPSLTDLSLTGSCQIGSRFEGEWPRPAVDRFIERSRCVLTTIMLDELPLTGDDILSIIDLTPSLEDLTIREIWTRDWHDYKGVPKNAVQTVDRTFLSKLILPKWQTQEDHSSPIPLFLPNIRSLELRVHGHFDAGQEFIDVVKSRWYPRSEPCQPGYRSLRTATLVILKQQVEEDLYKPLKVFESEGMRVVVKAGQKFVV